MTDPPAPRRRGRPPSVRARRAVLEAALASLTEGGPASVTMDALATRAGVSKATIYRHWTCKEDICKEAVAALRARTAPPREAHEPAEALEACAAALARDLSATQRGHRIAEIAAAAGSDRHLARIWEEAVLAPHRDTIRDVLRRAVRDGDVAPETDPDFATDLIVAPILRRIIARGPRGLREYARRTAATVWRGVRR